MTPDLWAKIKPILHVASILSTKEQTAFLARTCGGDPAFRAKVESLLDVNRDLQLEQKPVHPLLDCVAPTRQIGGYRLLHQLGEGGMSQVFLAVRESSLSQRLVALKVLSPGLEEDCLFTRRFFAERYFLSRIDHPAVIKLLDWGRNADGRPYLVTQFVDGQPIDRFCETQRYSARQRLQLLARVCRVVHEVHSRGIIHGDLKPGNILIDPSGAPKLLDFGIAVSRDRLQSTPLSDLVEPSPLATPSYASPEQMRQHPLSRATDIYSLGVLLCQLLTGRLPNGRPKRGQHFTPPTATRIVQIMRALSADPRLRSVEKGVARILILALCPNPQHRLNSARRLAEDLDRLAAVFKPARIAACQQTFARPAT